MEEADHAGEPLPRRFVDHGKSGGARAGELRDDVGRLEADVMEALAVTVDGVYAVPDVSTGAPAHIGGKPLSIQKTTVAGDVPVHDTPPAPEPAQPPAATPAPAPAAPSVGRLTRIRVTSRISLTDARRGGIRVSFIVPAGAQVVRVRLAKDVVLGPVARTRLSRAHAIRPSCDPP